MSLYSIHSFLLILLLALINPCHGARSAATSFCKCICFNNSTIIALNPPQSSTNAASLHNLDTRSPHALPADGDGRGDETASPPHHKLTCADCTRAFCLDYNLPICKNAREEDVFTTCFHRDSLKDETVVVVFIFATAGLLAWAAVKPWVDWLRERNTFVPLMQHDQGSGDTGVRRPNAAGRTSRQPRSDEVHSGSSRVTGADGRGEEEAFTVGSYDDDVHADQDAVDIASDMPSGSDSNVRFRS